MVRTVLCLFYHTHKRRIPYQRRPNLLNLALATFTEGHLVRLHLSVCLLVSSLLPGTPFSWSSLHTHTHSPHYFSFFLLFRLFLGQGFSRIPPFLTSGRLCPRQDLSKGAFPHQTSGSFLPTPWALTCSDPPE